MPNEKIREQNIERVLEVAFHCFLKFGIEQTTQTMIAEKSNLTFRSVSRYFKDKIDLVVQTAGWVGRYVCKLDGKTIENMDVAAKCKSGIEILEAFLRSIECIYLDNPQIFALKGEFDVYIHRHGITREQGYIALWKNFNPYKMLTRICEIGYADGTMRHFMEPVAEGRYCCNSLFCFLQQLPLGETMTKEEAKMHIETFIERIIEMYRVKSQTAEENR